MSKMLQRTRVKVTKKKKEFDWLGFWIWSSIILIFIAAFSPYPWISYIITAVSIIGLHLIFYLQNRRIERVIRRIKRFGKNRKQYFKICPSCGEKLMLSEEYCTKCGKKQE